MFFSADVESDVVQPSKKKGQGKKDGRFSGFLMSHILQSRLFLPSTIEKDY